ncbi:unnamed protein product [Colias eurytheme]|nr:unnamed protein product [Colias eurytheme]
MDEGSKVKWGGQGVKAPVHQEARSSSRARGTRAVTHARRKAPGWGGARLTLFKLFLRTVIMHWSVCNPKFS